MSYNSLEIEGPSHEIEKIANQLNGDFAYEQLFPIPEETTDKETWKKTHWGATIAEDIYLNVHKGTRTVSPAIMIGVEADGLITKWTEKVSIDYPEAVFTLEVDPNNTEDYRKIVFKAGKKQSNQPTLF